MASKICKGCGMLVSKGAKNCPRCGVLVRRTSLFTWIVIASVIVLFISFSIAEKTQTGASQHKPVTLKSESKEKESRNQNVSITDLQISFTNKQIGKGTGFYGETNLPDGTKLGIHLEKNGKGCGSDFDIYVSGGKFNSAPFTSHGYPLAGTYNVELFTVFNKLWQTKDILVLLEDYYSENISIGSYGWKKLKINQIITLLATNNSEQQEYVKKKTDEIVEMNIFLQELESFRITLMAVETLQQFNRMIRDWNIRLDSARGEFDTQFGETMGEYTGYCPQAHLYIGIGYGTLASQTWLAKKSFLEGRKPDTKMLQSNIEVEEYISTARRHLEACMNEISN